MGNYNGSCKELKLTTSQTRGKLGVLLIHAGNVKQMMMAYLAVQCMTVVKAFKNQCIPRKNLLFERYKLWQIKRDENEPVLLPH